MFAEERQERIYQIVNARSSVKVSELSDELAISEVTIRRDLEELQRQKRLIRTHGGAMSTYSAGTAIVFSQLISKDAHLKRCIAQCAYDMIQEDDTILLDTSSTVNELVHLIATGTKNLRVITTSIVAIQALQKVEHCTVQIVGGEINYAHDTVEGSAACRYISNLRVDKAFIGINGIDETFGFSTPRYPDADIKDAMLQSAHCSFVLADHTKLCKTYLAHINTPDYLITDRMMPGFCYESLDGTAVHFAADDAPDGAAEDTP